jgi:hypothetical protein
MSGPDGEGYGICNETPGQNYYDYATSDTGNWKAPILLSHTTSSVKIARTTSDGHWTLTQTITKTSTPSITVAMALKNNQGVSKVAYLVRYADVNPNGYGAYWAAATVNSAFAYPWYDPAPPPPYYGLQLQNVGTPPFGYWQAFVQTVASGPNACAFAANDSGGNWAGSGAGAPSFVMAYVGPLPVGGTKTVTLTYRGF